MKRFVLGMVVLACLACTPTSSPGESLCTLEWALARIQPYLDSWRPDAVLFFIIGSSLNRDAQLIEDDERSHWGLWYGHEDSSRAFDVYSSGEVRWEEGEGLQEPGIDYDNERIDNIFAPVIDYLDENYEESDCSFHLFTEYNDPELSDNPYCWLACYSSMERHLFDAYVDVVTFEILKITEW
jgi:hypothetical protein